MTIQPRDGILDIRPYKPGAADAPGIENPVKLSSNENALGCSDKAAEAFRNASSNLHIYPDGGATLLRETIAREEGLNADNIVCGCGSDELSLLGRAYLNPGDKVVQSQYGFLVYRLVAMQSRCDIVSAPERAIARTLTPSLRPRVMTPRSSSSPIRTIRPEPMCRTPRSFVCARPCRRPPCW